MLGGLGNAPIANLVQTLENNGIVVWRTLLSAETLDAFSECRNPHPVIVLSSDKANYFRSRTDAGHELAHLVMHRRVDRKALTKASDFKVLEDQAHYFGGALLLPADAFQKELWGLSLGAFRSLKPRWGASMGLQITSRLASQRAAGRVGARGDPSGCVSSGWAR